MSTRAEIMAALAAIFDRPKSSVEAVDRVLTDAGLRTRAARGRAAQAMSAEDFANVTMGLMGGWSLRETPQMVERLGALHLRDGEMVEFDLEEDGEMIGIQRSADLTTHQILETNLPILYPRNKLPMARSLTGSLASLLERIPALDDLETCRLTLYPETGGALLEFRLGPRRYTLRFGAGDRFPPAGVFHRTLVLRAAGLKRIADVFHGQNG